MSDARRLWWILWDVPQVDILPAGLHLRSIGLRYSTGPLQYLMKVDIVLVILPLLGLGNWLRVKLRSRPPKSKRSLSMEDLLADSSKFMPLKLAHHFLGLRASKIADFRGPTDGASGETTGGALDGSVTGRSDNIDIAILVPMA